MPLRSAEEREPRERRSSPNELALAVAKLEWQRAANDERWQRLDKRMEALELVLQESLSRQRADRSGLYVGIAIIVLIINVAVPIIARLIGH